MCFDQLLVVAVMQKADCVEDVAKENSFYPNELIEQCLILRKPDEATDQDRLIAMADSGSADAAWIEYSSSRDTHGGMEAVRLVGEPSQDRSMLEETVDNEWRKSDGTVGLPPRVLHCVARVAQPVLATDIAATRHREIEAAKSGHALWEENVWRFTDTEMDACLYSLNQSLLRSYTLTYHYTDRATGEAVCEAGSGIQSLSGNGVHVCLQSPVSLGWESHAGATFLTNVVHTFPAIDEQHVEIMLVVAVPSVALPTDYHQSDGLVKIPDTFLQERSTGEQQYSNAHILKCYGLDEPRQLPPGHTVQQASLSTDSPGLELRQPSESDEASSGKPSPPPLPDHPVQPTKKLSYRERVATAVNWAEEMTGWDIDRDGDVGVMGSAPMAQTPVSRSLSDPGGGGQRVKPPSLATLTRTSQFAGRLTPPALATLTPTPESTTTGSRGLVVPPRTRRAPPEPATTSTPSIGGAEGVSVDGPTSRSSTPPRRRVPPLPRTPAAARMSSHAKAVVAARRFESEP
eukprot:COSAG06_NODE_1406_length_9552_cov_7.866286_4_plen_517_part_00